MKRISKNGPKENSFLFLLRPVEDIIPDLVGTVIDKANRQGLESLPVCWYIDPCTVLCGHRRTLRVMILTFQHVFSGTNGRFY